jgi:hypothetical protein
MKLKTTILALLSTIVVMALLIFVPVIAAWTFLAIAIFMILHAMIDLIDFHFKHKNK